MNTDNNDWMQKNADLKGATELLNFLEERIYELNQSSLPRDKKLIITFSKYVDSINQERKNIILDIHKEV